MVAASTVGRTEMNSIRCFKMKSASKGMLSCGVQCVWLESWMGGWECLTFPNCLLFWPHTGDQGCFTSKHRNWNKKTKQKKVTVGLKRMRVWLKENNLWGFGCLAPSLPARRLLLSSGLQPTMPLPDRRGDLADREAEERQSTEAHRTTQPPGWASKLKHLFQSIGL